MRLEELLFIDIESSGLDERSYPIQIGGAWPTKDIDTFQFLIQPIPEWTYWSEEAENLHGFTRDECLADGLDIEAAVNRIEEMTAAGMVFVDNLPWDTFWIDRLYEALGRGRKFEIRDVSQVYHSVIKALGIPDKEYTARVGAMQDLATLSYPHTHKADDDSARHAATARALADREFRDKLWKRYNEVMSE